MAKQIMKYKDNDTIPSKAKYLRSEYLITDTILSSDGIAPPKYKTALFHWYELELPKGKKSNAR